MDICRQPATELAALVRRKALSAREVVEAHLARIAELNPLVNAIVTLDPGLAIEGARQADERQARGEPMGPLHGLPIAHKDLQATAGMRTTFGSPIFRDHVPDSSSPLVERLRRAGAINIGKTNTPEFGAGSQTFNPIFGATLNPYDLTKTCGGSSGGAAVALACGMLPIADGTDMGGSLRNPAAFCGVVGMRPSAGVIGADTSSAWSALSVEGPMARTAADVRLLLGAMVGDTREASEFARGSREGRRIAWATTIESMPFDPAVSAVVARQREVFEALGCRVAEASPDFSGADETFKVLRGQAFVQKHGTVVNAHRAMVKETVLWEVDRGAKLTRDQLAGASRGRQQLQSRMKQFFASCDFFVLPTTQVPPFDVKEPFVRQINGETMDTYIDWMRSCYFISVVGLPAISVPCGFTRDGLPVGLQIVGREEDDWSVLDLAIAYEQARGPFPPPDLRPADAAPQPPHPTP